MNGISPITLPMINTIVIIPMIMYQMIYFPQPILDILSNISPNLNAAPSSSYKARFAIAIVSNNLNILKINFFYSSAQKDQMEYT